MAQFETLCPYFEEESVPKTSLSSRGQNLEDESTVSALQQERKTVGSIFFSCVSVTNCRHDRCEGF